MHAASPAKPAHALPRVPVRLRAMAQSWPSATGCKTASRKKSSFSRLRAHARCVQSRTTSKQNALFPVASVSGALVLRFPGQYADDEAGSFYNYFRSYQPNQGRYTQADPIGLGGGLNRYMYVNGNPLMYTDPLGLNPVAGAIGGAQIGTAIFPGVGTVIGGVVGAGLGVLAGYGLDRMLAKPPENAHDPNGPKAPGQPGPDDGYFPPKGGPNWVPNPNPGGGGSSWGWEDKKGDVWCPTGQGGRSHSGPHWDVQTPGGDYRNVKPKR